MQLCVIIPTCARPVWLARCLDAVYQSISYATQHFPNLHVSVIVVDDDPARSASSILCNFPHITYLHGPCRGPAAARNLGAHHAQKNLSQLNLFTDDDCVPSLTFVHAYLSSYMQNPHPLMLGPTTCIEGCTSPFLTAPINPQGTHKISCNFACTPHFFQKLQGFDERFLFYGYEDWDFFQRAELLGTPAVFIPQASVDHPPRPMARVDKRVRTLRNLFLFQLKHGLTPSLSYILRHWLAQWRNRLLIRASFFVRMRALASALAELILSMAYFDRLLAEAQQALLTPHGTFRNTKSPISSS